MDNLIEKGTISPDEFKGNDYEKVQSAIIHAIANKKSVALSRMFDVTNQNPLFIDKSNDRWSLQFFGSGGGFTKTNNGFLFSSNKDVIGDLNFNMVKFEGVSGAGLKIFNSKKIIRVFSLGCIYRGVDTIASSVDSYLQSYRFNGDSIVGGKGNAIECAGAFDTVFSSVLVEQRENFFKQFKNTPSPYPSLYNVTFRDVCIEGLTGFAYHFCSANLLTIDGGYYEKNIGGDIWFDNTGVYTAVSISNIRSQAIDENPNKLSVIRWGGTIQSAKTFNVVSIGMPVNDTSDVIMGYITTENERHQNNGVVRNIDPSNRLIKQASSTLITKNENVSLSDFGIYRRLASSINVNISGNSYEKYSIDMRQRINFDDSVSIQLIKPNELEIVLCSYQKKSANILEVWIKNNSTSMANIQIYVTILQPFFSISG
ncbi:hypothetical protein [Peribacillus sp. YIM B13477]|uniref:hypothetical protein n=1 Tax=Peribacillus sp. YIM B13477 TaxID=3366300 RepID=UPI00366BD5AB